MTGEEGMSCPGGRCYDYLNIKIPVLLLSIRTARMCVAQHALELCLSISGVYKVTRLASLRSSYCLFRARCSVRPVVAGLEGVLSGAERCGLKLQWRRTVLIARF